MALHRLSKSKVFRVDYCGCTAAALLLDEQIIRDGIDFIRKIKTKRDYVKTSINILKDGLKIAYDDDQKFSTVVSSKMIASSSIGRVPADDTVGVVYISPLNGQHFPAFIHVYRCETVRIAHKLLSRLQAYLLVESHRIEVFRLEQQLLSRNLLNMENFKAMRSRKSDMGASSSPSKNDENRQEKKFDPIKHITEELQKKISSPDPILFPAKDYDTIHAAHGHLERAQAWRSTQPEIIGCLPSNLEDNRKRIDLPTNGVSRSDERKNGFAKENTSEHPQLVTRRSDTTIDPVEAVSLAFDFLKDETCSVFTDNDNAIDPVEIQPPAKPSVYHFQPFQKAAAITKKFVSRNESYGLKNGIQQSNSSSRQNLDMHSNNNNYHRPPQQHFKQDEHRARSEMQLYHDESFEKHRNPLYQNRLSKNNGHGIVMNPIWSSEAPNMSGSQPNLLSYDNHIDSKQFLRRQISPPISKDISSMPTPNGLYSSYPDDKSELLRKQQPKRPMPEQHILNRKSTIESQYQDKNEFILRPSNNQPSRHSQYSNRHMFRDTRPHSMHDHATALDVYY